MVTIHFSNGEKSDVDGTVEEMQSTLNVGHGGSVVLKTRQGKSVLVYTAQVTHLHEAPGRGAHAF